MDARLLAVRNAMKLRKPNFHVQNSNDPKKRFAGRWKRPKGLQNKMRERRKGNPRYIEPGYGSPATVKGATREGLFPIMVSRASDLTKVKEGFGAIISATVGLRKKAEIVKAATEKKLKLLNVNAADFVKLFEESISQRKQKRQRFIQGKKTKTAKKQAAETTGKKEPEKDANIEGKLDEDAKKKAEKAEKDKILTKASY